ncbi:MAG: hypothetical protein OER21_14085 [Gemmatimonadota bacterium]|nr:hypothetical protein [Gemmatimonadota bacterium]
MRVVPAALALLIGLASVPLAAAQGQVRRERPTAFPLQVVPFLSLGFGGGKRAVEAPSSGCVGADCREYSYGSGPELGVQVQFPIASTVGLAATGAIGRPSRVVCTQGTCNSPESVTAIRGNVLLLWRLKARAPVFFGIGPAVVRFDPAAATDQPAVVEFGGVGVVGVDFGISGNVGGRLLWWNYVLQPSSDAIPANIEASGLAWDMALGLGIRVALGS